VTLHWPPAPPEHLASYQPWDQPGQAPDDAHPDGSGQGLPDPPQAGLSDPRLIAGVGEISAMMATQLDDGASPAAVMPVIRDTARGWLELQVRAGLLPATAGSALDELARAVHDQRYELGPVTAYLRDPQVENVDINGCDQVWITYATGERVAAPPVAASDDALIAMVRTWATRGGQTARAPRAESRKPFPWGHSASMLALRSKSRRSASGWSGRRTVRWAGTGWWKRR
jgi:hypothetical protein